MKDCIDSETLRGLIVFECPNYEGRQSNIKIKSKSECKWAPAKSNLEIKCNALTVFKIGNISVGRLRHTIRTFEYMYISGWGTKFEGTWVEITKWMGWDIVRN